MNDQDMNGKVILKDSATVVATQRSSRMKVQSRLELAEMKLKRR